MKVGLVRGHLVVRSKAHGADQSLPFQYNPETVRRQLAPQQTGGGAGDQSDASYLMGPPTETISLEIELDSTDTPSANPNLVKANGVLPYLNLLETLLYPDSDAVKRNRKKLSQGVLELIPYPAPFVRLVLGSRSMPVRLESCSITEQIFDPMLNPIRAQVELQFKVVNYAQVTPGNLDFDRFLSYQEAKERRAKQAATQKPPRGRGH